MKNGLIAALATAWSVPGEWEQAILICRIAASIPGGEQVNYESVWNGVGGNHRSWLLAWWMAERVRSERLYSDEQHVNAEAAIRIALEVVSR